MNAPDIAHDDGSDSNEFVSYGGARGISQSGVIQDGAPDVVEKHVGERTEHDPELIGPPVVAAGSSGVFKTTKPQDAPRTGLYPPLSAGRCHAAVLRGH